MKVKGGSQHLDLVVLQDEGIKNIGESSQGA